MLFKVDMGIQQVERKEYLIVLFYIVKFLFEFLIVFF